MSDKERDSIQEMEDIQKGLEAFLQQEMQEMQASGAGARRSTGECGDTLCGASGSRMSYTADV